MILMMRIIKERYRWIDLSAISIDYNTIYLGNTQALEDDTAWSVTLIQQLNQTAIIFLPQNSCSTNRKTSPR